MRVAIIVSKGRPLSFKTTADSSLPAWSPIRHRTRPERRRLSGQTQRRQQERSGAGQGRRRLANHPEPLHRPPHRSRRRIALLRQTRALAATTLVSALFSFKLRDQTLLRLPANHTMVTPDDSNVTVWQRLSKQWDFVGPPFRPTAEDIGFASTVLNSTLNAKQPGALTSILLGVTPELAEILANTRSLEIDHSIQMLNWSWLKFPRGRLAAPIAGQWTSLPIRKECIDLIFGDGCNIQLEFPGAYQAWFGEMARVLRPGGKVVLRVYVSPETPEHSKTVIDDLMRRRIGNPNVLRMRLFMALQPSAPEGIRLSDISDFWTSLKIDRNFLTTDLGWPADAIGILDMFKDMNLRYSFPTLAELKMVFAEHFTELGRRIPGYEIGSRCPTIVLQRIGS